MDKHITLKKQHSKALKRKEEYLLSNKKKSTSACYMKVGSKDKKTADWRIDANIPDYVRISLDEITDEGVVSIAMQLLIMAHDDYLKALKTIKRLKDKENLTPTERSVLSAAFKEKESSERFYLSVDYQIYSLGRGIPGEDVIDIIKNEAEYKEGE